MLTIPVVIEAPIEVCNNAASNCDGDSKQVDENENLIFHHTSVSDYEIIPYHENIGFIKIVEVGNDQLRVLVSLALLFV